MKSRYRLSSRDGEINSLIEEMMKSINFRLSGENQLVTHYWKVEKTEVKIYFLRQKRYLLFSFEGFGDLMGYTLAMVGAEEEIRPAPIGLNGDVTLYVPYMLPSKIKLGIIPPKFISW